MENLQSWNNRPRASAKAAEKRLHTHTSKHREAFLRRRALAMVKKEPANEASDGGRENVAIRGEDIRSQFDWLVRVCVRNVSRELLKVRVRKRA